MEAVGQYNSNYPAVSIPKLVHARYASGRVAMPAHSKQFQLSGFKHVAAVPVSGDRGGYSLSRLRSIDLLIERLKNIRGDIELPLESSQTLSSEGKATKDRLDALIEELSDKLHAEALRAEQTPYKGVAGTSLRGLLVDFTL